MQKLNKDLREAKMMILPSENEGNYFCVELNFAILYKQTPLFCGKNQRNYKARVHYIFKRNSTKTLVVQTRNQNPQNIQLAKIRAFMVYIFPSKILL